ncbi:hypothetical protein BDV93DRAFT_540655 [Ceratobasidium sp. AG-I]|nr:hypothetical protein BDV93DRAFT_540655 [Ceratobasidium sp. AG-I]
MAYEDQVSPLVYRASALLQAAGLSLLEEQVLLPRLSRRLSEPPTPRSDVLGTNLPPGPLEDIARMGVRDELKELTLGRVGLCLLCFKDYRLSSALSAPAMVKFSHSMSPHIASGEPTISYATFRLHLVMHCNPYAQAYRDSMSASDYDESELGVYIEPLHLDSLLSLWTSAMRPATSLMNAYMLTAHDPQFNLNGVMERRRGIAGCWISRKSRQGDTVVGAFKMFLRHECNSDCSHMICGPSSGKIMQNWSSALGYRAPPEYPGRSGFSIVRSRRGTLSGTAAGFDGELSHSFLPSYFVYLFVTCGCLSLSLRHITGSHITGHPHALGPQQC